MEGRSARARSYEGARQSHGVSRVALIMAIILVGVMGTLASTQQHNAQVFSIQNVKPASQVAPATVGRIENSVWNRSWDYDSNYNCFLCTDGQFIYTTNSYVNASRGNRQDLDLVKWTREGNVEWNVTWGPSLLGIASYQICYREGFLYIVGDTDTGTEQKPFLSKWSMGGTLQWATQWDCPGVSFTSLVLDTTGIYVLASSVISYPANMSLVKFDYDGNEVWNNTQIIGDSIAAFRLVMYENDLYTTLSNTTTFQVIKWQLDGSFMSVFTRNCTSYGINNIIYDDTGVYLFAYYTPCRILKYNHSGNLVWNVTLPQNHGQSFLKIDRTLLISFKSIVSLGEDGNIIDNYPNLTGNSEILDCLVLDGEFYGSGYNESLGQSLLFKCALDHYPVVEYTSDLTVVRGDQQFFVLSWTISDDYTSNLATQLWIDGVESNTMPGSWMGYPNMTRIDQTFYVEGASDGTHNYTLLVDDNKLITQATVLITVLPRFPIEVVIVAIGSAAGGIVVMALLVRRKKRLGGKLPQLPTAPA